MESLIGSLIEWGWQYLSSSDEKIVFPETVILPSWSYYKGELRFNDITIVRRNKGFLITDRNRVRYYPHRSYYDVEVPVLGMANRTIRIDDDITIPVSSYIVVIIHIDDNCFTADITNDGTPVVDIVAHRFGESDSLQSHRFGESDPLRDHRFRLIERGDVLTNPTTFPHRSYDYLTKEFTVYDDLNHLLYSKRIEDDDTVKRLLESDYQSLINGIP